MNPPQLAPPKLIQDKPSLHSLAKTLRSQPRIAVDTESNSLYVYQEQVCLIQFSVPDIDYLVDPLALPDLDPLASIFANPKIEKIFHGAEYDVVCLKRDFDFSFANLFDTRIASRTLGWKRNGLGYLLETAFGVHLKKRYQRANWGSRPLSPDLLDYARLDTHYLISLRDRFAEELHAAGRWQEAREACEFLAYANPHENGFDPEGYWHINHSHGLTPRQMAVLREVYLFRDKQARHLNRPPFKIMGDKTLLAIAQSTPKDLDELSTLAGMTPRQINRYGKGLLAAIKHGLQAPHPRKPRNKPVEMDVQMRYEALHAWRKGVARARKVESDIVLPREVLWEIARTAPRSANALQQIMSRLPWRFQTYGQEIMSVLRD
jgi:ribonuclease D